MTTERQQQSTNGRVKIEQQIAHAREALRANPKGGRLRGRLLVPALLAIGVIFVLRRFEQSAGN